MKTIRELLGLEQVVGKNYNKAVALPNPDPILLYGVELEIEHCEQYDNWRVAGITATEDGSLRNFGKEFITVPMSYSNLAFCLNTFFTKAKLTEENYSERTSVHIHANVQDLTMPQVGTICLLYTVFEPLFYAFAGGDRDKNIFCVPWSETSLSQNYITNFVDGGLNSVKRWQKYTGLNILPVFKQGTLEFRHLPGTNDLQRILTWCRIIARLWQWARNNDFYETREQICSLNTNSHYGQFFEKVFAEEAQALYCRNFEELLEEGVLSVKYASIAVGKVKKKEDGRLNVTIVKHNDMYVITVHDWGGAALVIAPGTRRLRIQKHNKYVQVDNVIYQYDQGQGYVVAVRHYQQDLPEGFDVEIPREDVPAPEGWRAVVNRNNIFANPVQGADVVFNDIFAAPGINANRVRF